MKKIEVKGFVREVPGCVVYEKLQCQTFENINFAIGG